MKFCKHCGNPLSSELKFCTKCGTAITSKQKENTTNIPHEQEAAEKEHRSVEGENITNITPPQDSSDYLQKLNSNEDTSDSVSRKSRVKESNRPTTTKRKFPKWAYGVGAAAVLCIVTIGIVVAVNGGEDKVTEVATTEPVEEVEVEAETETNEKPPSITQEEISALFPTWQKIKHEIININGSYYTLLALAQDEIEYEETVKIVVVGYNSKTEENKWSSVWESEEYYADSMIEMDSHIGDFFVVNPENNAVAMVVFNVMHSGTARTYETFAIEINEEGIGEVAWSGNGSYIEQKEEFIEVSVLGKVQLAVEEGAVKITEIPRSEVGSSDALKINFTLSSDGLVTPSEDEEIYVKVGQPITFVPADNKTKSLFDEGEIAIYYSSMENAPITTSNANLVYAGNEFNFTSEGSFGFLLDYYSEGSDNSTPPYTFIVHVGDGVKPAESEENKEVPAASTEIEAPFPLGAPLSELKNHYGEPTSDSYYSGARLVTFDKEGYFIDDLDETVMGYYFAAPTLSVFGATVGMTVQEINSLYSLTAESYFDDYETQLYAHAYSKNGYKIFFYSEKQFGPTSSVWVVRE